MLSFARLPAPSCGLAATSTQPQSLSFLHHLTSPATAPHPGSSAVARPGQERLGKMFQRAVIRSAPPRALQRGLLLFLILHKVLKGCVCKQQAPSRCLQGIGLEAREGSKRRRRQTVLRGCGVRSPPGRGHALQLITAVSGVTCSTGRSQRYFVAP